MPLTALRRKLRSWLQRLRRNRNHRKVPVEQDEEKQPIQCTDPSETVDESVMVPARFYLPERQGPVQHNKLPPLQRFCNPVECTEPSSAVNFVLPLRRLYFQKEPLFKVLIQLPRLCKIC
ncbi:hypothetical protein OS493_026875 [Desmophyllum pertusum]|uniref:Uncharacterized protein n=1 Tax=Desmophyllum pertusum TaxID=174260 RepID=A0A9W9ZCS9_9CNID|nr:hypothetical protein OS493_026875 [Desmophyllum pertusum]